jgi:hypothetical protein
VLADGEVQYDSDPDLDSVEGKNQKGQNEHSTPKNGRKQSADKAIR